MSLTTRLSAFFLAALAFVLLGFSGGLFLLVRRHLALQVDQRLEAAMQTLVAAIEVHPEDVEWEPLERHVFLGDDNGADQVRWLVQDPAGRLLDCSRNLEPAPGEHHAAAWPQSAAGWRLLIRRVRAGCFRAEAIDGAGGPYFGDPVAGVAPDQLPGWKALPADRTFRGSALTIRGALSWQPVAASLAQLAWALGGVSAGLWGVGALLSRRVCRRALQPVIRMAGAARALRADEPGQLLPVARSGDELEDLGRAFNDLLVRLQEVLERQQRFTGDASHQLRTPLTAMLGQVEVALRQDRTPDEYRRVLQVVQRRAGQMSQIVELLLFLARMPAQTELPQTRVVSLADWLDGHLRHWSDHPRAADIHWLGPEEAPAREVRIQPALLGQLLDNLLDNACKYSEPGAPITIRVERAWRGVELTVADRGHGISPEDLPHVCDPFYRSAEARRLGRPGVGLGLTVAQRIAKALGGSLRIASRPGEGSRFTVYLPAVSGAFARTNLGADGESAGPAAPEPADGPEMRESVGARKVHGTGGPG